MSAEAAGLDTPSWVSAILDQFEAARFFDEGDVAGHIFAAAKKVESPTPEEKKAADAECWAFCFLLHPDGTEPGGKIHFGPIVVSGDFRNPDIAWIDEAVLKYWERRMTEVRHPLLRARYADLVWDLSKPAGNLKPPIEAARVAVDGYVAASRLADAANLIPAAERLQRALRIAIGTGNSVRAEQVRDAMAELAARVNQTWGWVTLFDAFEEQIKIKLTIRELLHKLRQEYPLGTMWPIAKMSEGQIVAHIGPVDSDPEGALINGVADNIRGNRRLLEKAFDRLRSRYSAIPGQVLDFIYQSPFFTERFRGVVRQGVEAYFAGDHPKAISLLVPQIENTLRFVLQLVGRPPNKPKRGNQSGMTEKTLTDILEHEPAIVEVIGQAAHIYMVGFLADARGLNIRNKMCHGLMVEEDFNRWISDRVLHTVQLLGSFRRGRKETPTPWASNANPELEGETKCQL